MRPHPIIFQKLEEREGERLVHVREIVREQLIDHVVRFDERTFSELRRAFSAHPFRKKAAADDMVCFDGLVTPEHDSQKYLALLIVNRGSRHHIRITASEEAFLAMKAIFDSWSARIQNA